MTTELAQRILAETLVLYDTEALLRAIAYGEQGNSYYLSGSVAGLSSEGKLCG